METYESKIVEQSGLRYKIQVRLNQGVWQQRHIWYACEHSEPCYPCLNYYHEDEWIKSIQTRPDVTVYSRIS